MTSHQVVRAFNVTSSGSSRGQQCKLRRPQKQNKMRGVIDLTNVRIYSEPEFMFTHCIPARWYINHARGIYFLRKPIHRETNKILNKLNDIQDFPNDVYYFKICDLRLLYRCVLPSHNLKGNIYLICMFVSIFS